MLKAPIDHISFCEEINNTLHLWVDQDKLKKKKEEAETVFLETFYIECLKAWSSHCFSLKIRFWLSR